MLDDCAVAAVDALDARPRAAPAWDAEGFERLREAVRPELVPALEEVLAATTGVLSTLVRPVARGSTPSAAPALATSVADMRAQLDRLVFPGFVTATGFARLAGRRAATCRRSTPGCASCRRTPPATGCARRRCAQVQAEVDDVARRVAPSPALEQVRWMVEELRISLFAQPMRTRGPVSDKRIFKALDALLPVAPRARSPPPRSNRSSNGSGRTVRAGEWHGDQVAGRSKVASRPSLPPGPMRPLTVTDVSVLSCQPSRACSLSTFSTLLPLILPPIRPSRTSTTRYS